MKQIDIGVICDFFPPDNKAVSIRMVHLVKSLQEHDFTVTVYTSKKSRNLSGFRINSNISTPASNKDSIPLRLFKEIVFSLETFIKLLFSKHDLYLITSPPFTLAFCACFACILTGKKYILDIRDEYPEVYFEEGLMKSNGPAGRILKSVERFMYRKALLISTVTVRIKQKLQAKCQSNSKIWLFRNGYAEGFVPVQRKASRPFTVIFHGNLGKFQNPELIIDIANLCYQEGLDIQFDVYGWGNNSHLLKAKEFPNLTHHGELDIGEVRKILPMAHLGISFQRNTEISKNSFPSKVFEFIGAGIPSIITPISEAGDFVENNGLGFQFDPERRSAIFEKIKELAANNEEYQKVKMNVLNIREGLSRKCVSDEFSKNLNKFLLLHFYKS